MNLIGELRDVTPAICASFAAGQRREHPRDGRGPTTWRSARAAPASAATRAARPFRARATQFLPGLSTRVHRIPARLLRPGRLWPLAAPVAHCRQRAGHGVHACRGLAARPARDARSAERAGPRRGAALRPLRGAPGARRTSPKPWFRLEDIAGRRGGRGALGQRPASPTAKREARRRTSPASTSRSCATRPASSASATWSLLDGDGPLWYRGYATAEEAGLEGPLTALLKLWNAERIVVGHTPAPPFQRAGPAAGARVRDRHRHARVGLQGHRVGPRDCVGPRHRALRRRHPHRARAPSGRAATGRAASGAASHA